ncbi:MAG: alpha/beta fold hydrolase [Pseudomonadota bacterium]
MAQHSDKVVFTGSQGVDLAGRLERPAGPIKAYALFAHCFSCSKDVFAPNRIAKRLAALGYAVLRFDFTGLGQSDGDFANTNFSSNVEDLIAAAEFLSATYEAPKLLVGHSLGGAAVLVAAPQLPSVRAVATIAAPADAAHVAHNFEEWIDTIEKDGEAEVSLAGRPFKIKRQFLENIRNQNVEEATRDFKGATLFFHSPTDETVGIDNATRLFVAARHPKSFVGLEGADHLLTRPEDAAHVANTLAAWAARYLPDDPMQPIPKAEPGTIVVQETGFGQYQNVVVDGEHVFFVDEPVSLGGDDSAPGPTRLVAAALGACTSMTMRMYAERKGFDVDPITVRVVHDKHVEGEGGDKREVDRFERRISLSGRLSEEDHARILAIAERCPVHRTLSRANEIQTIIEP